MTGLLMRAVELKNLVSKNVPVTTNTEQVWLERIMTERQFFICSRRVSGQIKWATGKMFFSPISTEGEATSVNRCGKIYESLGNALCDDPAPHRFSLVALSLSLGPEI